MTAQLPQYLLVMQHLNAAMNQNRCPGAGALGECPATYSTTGNEFVSEIYLWKAGEGVKAADVVAWAERAGVSRDDMLLEQVLHDEWNRTFEGRTTDGCRHLRLFFKVHGLQAI